MSVALRFGWRDLLFANWPVDPAAVARRLPPALDVEEYDGSAWLSVVALRNVDTRPRGLPPAVGIDVPELNLRTYVTVGGEPGVYFFSLDAASLATVVGGRLTHRLPYYYARIRWRKTGDGIRIRSRRRHPGARPAHFTGCYGPAGEAFTAESSSLAAFLTERRRLYTRGGGGEVRHTDVSHERWRLVPADATIRDNTLVRASGFELPGVEPTLYYSRGVDVETTRSRPLADRE